ncbi:MAG: precorrin-6y C5,15-methyltransferase (decarboxylating) subunit CbiE [Synechocystis sp.]|nr:precorrin-6y C5,15-methyltransferase (decarboxylating) subunit CbiE [Synechocystis sp.]
MIHVIGIGLDGAAGLPSKTLGLIAQAKILAGGDRHLSYFPDHKEKWLPIQNFSTDLDNLKQALKQLETGELIVVLASGDPLFFGLGRLLLEKFPADQLQFHPHVSSIQLAFNRLKLPWQDAQIISAHGRSPDLLKQALQKGVEKLAILTDRQNHPGAIAKLCLALNLTTPYHAWVCENLGGEEEKIQGFDLIELAKCGPDDFAPLNVVILQQGLDQDRIIDLQTLPIFGIPDRHFASFGDRPGMITKQAIRVQILAALQLQPGQVIWDIGSGTGSVAIEVARLCPTGQVFAIEKTSAGQLLIEQNKDRFQVNNLTVIAGIAPGGLDPLPQPDRIFIGGSGGQLIPILDHCQLILKPQGKIVMAIASLEHLSLAIGWFRAKNWACTVQHLQISQSVNFAELTRFSPLNPIYLLSARYCADQLKIPK